jgi:hypothetical protein
MVKQVSFFEKIMPPLLFVNNRSGSLIAIFSLYIKSKINVSAWHEISGLSMYNHCL